MDEFASARLCTRAPPTLGLTVRLEELRTSFLRDCYVPTSSSIPKGKKFDYSIPCTRLHPGVCRRDITPAMRSCLAAMIRELATKRAGQFFQLSAEFDDGRLLNACNMLALNDKGLFVAVDAFLIGDSQPCLRQHDSGFFDFNCGENILMPFFESVAPTRVVLQLFEATDDPQNAADLTYIARAVPLKVRLASTVDLALDLETATSSAAAPASCC